MKAFWGSIVLFAALLSFLFFNAQYIRKSATFLQETADAMQIPAQRNQKLEEIEAFWKTNRKWAAMSMRHDDLDRIDELLTSLRWAQDAQEEDIFSYYRDQLQSILSEFDLNEQLSFDSVF